MTTQEAAAHPIFSNCSFFDLPSRFFESCSLISDLHEIPSVQPLANPCISRAFPAETTEEDEKKGFDVPRRLEPSWTCHRCRMKFESLEDQRLHFKSDLHQFNVKLQISGRKTIDADDFDDLAYASLSKDFDLSTISSSEEELEDVPTSRISTLVQERDMVKQKLYIRLQSGGVISLWRCLIMDSSEDIASGNPNSDSANGVRFELRGDELISRLNSLLHEPRDGTRLRTVLLTCGGHFAGSVFDGNSVIDHKTFHRYVVRAKAGQRQSVKDGAGKALRSAGSSLRRYNEAALKKEIYELLVSWKAFLDASSCIFVYAPSKNHHLLFEGDKLPGGILSSAIRHIPITVHRPTFQEARRVYRILTQVADEKSQEKFSPDPEITQSKVELAKTKRLPRDGASFKTTEIPAPKQVKMQAKRKIKIKKCQVAE
ncbi:zinc finger protein-like protein [Wolffia australiana]